MRNERGAYFYGMTRASLVGTLVSQVDRGVGAAELIANYRQAMATGFHQEDRRMPDDNRLNIRWGHRRLVRVRDGLAVTLQDISERKEYEVQLARLANEDSLTGLPNRHWFLHFALAALAHAEATGQGAALLFIDLDEFKQVNDSHGHAVGDRLLKAAATRLLAQLRPSDRVARRASGSTNSWSCSAPSTTTSRSAWWRSASSRLSASRSRSRRRGT